MPRRATDFVPWAHAHIPDLVYPILINNILSIYDSSGSIPNVMAKKSKLSDPALQDTELLLQLVKDLKEDIKKDINKGQEKVEDGELLITSLSCIAAKLMDVWVSALSLFLSAPYDESLKQSM